MSSLARSSSGTQNKSLKIQIKKRNSISRATNAQYEEIAMLLSSSNSVEDYRFMVLELLASWLSFSCLVLGKRITLLCCECFSKTAPEPESQAWDSDVESYMVSLLNLDVEDSELIPGSDHLQSGFPSPSLENISGESEFEDLNSESEPLFWPFEKFSWNNGQETWRFFAMSPRDDQHETLQCDSDFFDLRVRESETSPIASQLSTSSQSGAKIVEFGSERDGILEDSKSNSPYDFDSGLLEEEFKKEEVSIELLLGLGEFDGHEGVDDIEFDQYDFSLDDSLI